jgi:hypothetical protein
MTNEKDPRDETDAGAEPAPAREELEQHEPPYTLTGFLMSPKFGSAGSGGLEYERLPEAHDEDNR